MFFKRFLEVRFRSTKKKSIFVSENFFKMTISPLKIQHRPIFDDNFFFEFCQAAEGLQVERDKNGNIYIIEPTGFETGSFNQEVGTDAG